MSIDIDNLEQALELKQNLNRLNRLMTPHRPISLGVGEINSNGDIDDPLELSPTQRDDLLTTLKEQILADLDKLGVEI